MFRDARKFAFIVFALVLAVVAAGCSKLKARDNLNKGVQAFKAGQYDSAINFFQTARDLDPNLMNARLYLATAYRAQYVPGAPSDENIRYAEKAMEIYEGILRDEPQNLQAIDSMGWILFQLGGTRFPGKPLDFSKFERSRDYHLKHVQIKPDDPEPHYWIGVIEWTLAYNANAEARAKWNEKAPESKKLRKPEDPLPDKVREEFAAKYTEIVDNGIQHLKRALELNPEYDDAMAYLNLLYRQRADIVANKDERENYFVEADKLVDRVKEIKQKKAAQPAPPA
jgi:tetratricopeptide (TPR) repeat protein